MSTTLTLKVSDNTYELLLRASSQAGRTPEQVILEWVERKVVEADQDPLLQLAGAFESNIMDIGGKHNEKLVQVIIIIGALVFGLLSLFIVIQGQAATIATFTVNSLDDADDGTCDGSHCSLREAINAANNAVGADTINFSLSPDATIILYGNQLPIISDTLTIDGSTADNLTIDGTHFQIGSGTVATITSLTKTGGGMHEFGGGIYNNGELNLIDSRLINNRAYGEGGGIYNAGGTVDIIRTTISKNLGQGAGGGIYNAGGTINISDSTLDENFVFWTDGGGIYNNGGEIFVNNSTVSGNRCGGYHSYCNGGGIYNLDGTLHINSSTFSDNWAGGVSGVPPYGGGIYGGVVNLVNTIIANNDGGDCVAGSMPTNNNNLIEDGSCNPAFSGDPVLGPLQDNGGPTWTHALSFTSMAIDNGDDGICAAPPIDNLDQRGVERPIDGDGDGTPKCDIGAYEYPLLDELSYLPLVQRN